MANVGYINKEVAKMYGIPYSELTPEQKKILHEDSVRRAKLIKEREEAVLKNNLKAFEDEAKMERVLASIYRDCQKQILADVQETIAKVQKAGGEWSYANQSALTRSRGLFEQITAELTKLGQKEQIVFTQGLRHIYTDQFLRQVYELGQSISVKANFNRLNPALIQKTLDYPWSGAMFSDRLWQDKERLGRNLRVGLTQSMILGEGIPQITDRINKGIDTARYNAERVARTETKRVTYCAHDDVYKDTGVEELRYRCANGGDSRTCQYCRADNGKVFKRGEEPTLPRHPNCRCVYIPVVSDTFEDNELNELTGSVRGAENYEKWRKAEEEKIKEQSLKTSSKKDNDSAEALEKRLEEIDKEVSVWEDKRNDASSVRRGFYTMEEKGFTSMSEVDKAYDEAVKQLKELDEERDRVFNKYVNAKQAEAVVSNQPIPLTYTIQKNFSFSDGTEAVTTKKVRDATIATTNTGVQIITPTNLNTKKQLLTAQNIADVLDTLPDEVKKHCKQIQLVDYYNPLDSYWSKRYNMSGFYSYAVGGDGKITFFRNDSPRGSTRSVNNSTEWVRHTLNHELGHTIDKLVSSVLHYPTNSAYASDGTKYSLAIQADLAHCGELWASSYAVSSKSYHEDFADSVAEYVTDPFSFKKKFPNRYKYIEEVLSKL